jgi:hypothetical protein
MAVPLSLFPYLNDCHLRPTCAMRVFGEPKTAEREQEKYERDYPLWAMIERQKKEEGRGAGAVILVP